ncbi:MAG TPA: nicotinate phosphoribosyltransferase [Acidimicrobiales bacterium]|nr:nicotinate phosphoribosyltransferase [Acidimicrobiales bacterium]
MSAGPAGYTGGTVAGPQPSLAMVTDLYQLTMAAGYMADGLDRRPATFSLIVRRLPPSRGFLVAAGLNDALNALESLSFTDDDLRLLEETGLFGPEFLDRLAGIRFTGSVRAMPEGRLVSTGEPLLEVDAPLLEGQLVETTLLSHVGYQTTVATKAVRLRQAAGGRPLADFGLRAAPGPEAGMRLARCARLAGLTSTSNVAGSALYGLPPSGTMAHSFVQAHGDEAAAFESFGRLYGGASTLLVDTYDARTGIDRAVEAARAMAGRGATPAAVRIDSGDLAELSRLARRRLDEAGLAAVRVIATGGLDEHAIAALLEGGAPIDGFGVGSSLAVPRDAPALETAYKLVEVDGRPVRKTSEGKVTWPGRKQVWRLPGGRGDVLGLAGEEPPEPGAVPLMIGVMEAGRRLEVDACDLAAGAARVDADLGEMGPAQLRLDTPDPLPVTVSVGLRALTEGMSR